MDASLVTGMRTLIERLAADDDLDIDMGQLEFSIDDDKINIEEI